MSSSKALAGILGLLLGGAVHALEVLRIAPTGEDVPAAHQIVIDFDTEGVPLGTAPATPEQLAHLNVEPQLACDWRWINPRALACQLGEDAAFKLATRYKVKVRSGFPGLEGARTAADRVATFTTARPRLLWARFHRWQALGVPLVRLRFNQPVTKASLERTLKFQVSGRYFGVLPEVSSWEHDHEMPIGAGPLEARQTWLAVPLKALPGDRSVQIKLRPGLRAPGGSLAGQEHRAELVLHTHPAFRLLGVGCQGDDGYLQISAAQADPPACDPDGGFALRFSAPIVGSEVRPKVTITPALDGMAWQGDRDALRYSHSQGQSYDLVWYGALEPRQTYTVRITQADGVEDQFGRTLGEAPVLTLRTGARRPEAFLPYDEAVLEAGIDSDLPVRLVNVDSARLRYRVLEPSGVRSSAEKAIEIPHAPDRTLALSMGVRDMLTGSGIVSAELETHPERALSSYRRHFTAQVTPYQVHMKLGHFRSLVWVTHLRTGQGVAGATVRLYRGHAVDEAPEDARTFTTDERGTAWLPGTADLDPQLETLGWRCGAGCKKWRVRVDGPDGLAVLPLTHSYRQSVWRTSEGSLYLNQNQRYGHARAWGMTAQGVYRPGDTVQYKLYVRGQSNRTWTLPPRGSYTLTVEDPMGREVHVEEGASLNAFGTLDGELALPTNSVMGWYRATVSAPMLPGALHAFEFLVTEFEPSPFKVRTTLNGDRFDRDATVDVATEATLHSGGAYRDGTVRTVVRLVPEAVRFDHPVTQRFRFGSESQDAGVELARLDGELDDDGQHQAEVRLADAPPNVLFGRVVVESSVQDDRGKRVAHSSSARYQGVAHFVGLRRDRWLSEAGETADVELVVADATGQPVEGIPIDVRIERRAVKSARVRGAGNAYLTEYLESWVPVATCRWRSATTPGTCAFVPEQPGSYRAVARTPEGHETSIGLWVTGRGYVRWNDDETKALPLVPESADLSVGDTARILVKNPIPGARALVSVERYGVLRAFEVVLKGSTPVIEIPLQADDAPGVYVSVALFSPRVEAPPLENSEGGQALDLGKPAFRLGYVGLTVKDPDRRFAVQAATAAQTYKPRDTVAVALRSEPATELAVVVIDEAVLDLVRGGTTYYDPQQGFDGLHGVDVDSYSLIERLVGRINFDRKGANPGGDGGATLAMRSIIDYVAHWNPSVRVGDAGNASVTFELPDNLTGWRVLVLGADAGGRFGFGNTRFVTNLDTELRPVMPNQVGEGDAFSAAFSVLNRTDKHRTLSVSIEANGALAEPVSAVETIELAPYERAVVRTPVQAGLVRDEDDIHFSVVAADDVAKDGLQHTLPVLKRRVLTVVADHGSLSDASSSRTLPLQMPAEVYTDVGGLQIDVSASVVGQMSDAFRYMRDYPYVCWEQRLSKAVMAKQYQRLKPYLEDGLAWPGAQGLPAYTEGNASSFQAPNGGMAYYVPQDAHVSPYLSAYTALMLPWLSEGQSSGGIQPRLHAYLKTLLKREHIGFGFRGQSVLTVRAVALHALARTGDVKRREVLRLLERRADLEPFAAANLLQAAQHVGSEADRLVLTELLSGRLHRSSGLVTLRGDASSRLMHGSAVRDQCAVLSALSGEDSVPQDLLAGLMRSIDAARKSRGHWYNTQENLFCSKAIADYAERFEAQAPNFELRATLGDDVIGSVSISSRGGSDSLRASAQTLQPGLAQALKLERLGEGRAYYAARMTYAPLNPPRDPVNAGFGIRRSYFVQRDGSWVALDLQQAVQRGELIRVDLNVSVPASANFVIVDDPVPGGFEPVERNLATASEVDANVEHLAGGFYHRSLGHRAARFYADRVAAGTHRLTYAVQAIATGRFEAPGARIEAMYDPDVYGVSGAAVVEVSE